MAAQSSSRQGKGIAARAVVVAGLALSLGACSQSAEQLLGGSLTPQESQTQVATSAAPARSELEKATEHWGKEHAKSPRDGKAAINYAMNLKAMDRKPEAFAVMQASYMYNAQDRDFLSEFGRLALDQGHAPLAQQLLERADDPAKPDWKVLSARGAALAKQGKYKEAIPFFERAHLLVPTQASVMSNLALAYTMDGQAGRAEPLLRQATAADESDPRVRQNLALVLQLEGKSAEANRVAMGVDQQPLMTAPVSVVSNPLPPPARVAAAPARRSTRAPVAHAAAIDADADPEAVIRAALSADIALDKTRARPIATSSTPQQ
ncbi:MAG: tetratricopeptide repeat protein [Hyphomicrobiaceae bacterium]